MQNLVFGWVSDTVQSNFAAWSSWEKYGDEVAANDFFQKTRQEAERQGLKWFCCDAE